ncbi:MAG: dicarboxylate/amino acid:cation symporter [Synechococcales bacterium]|nr:dicarboxylate/amino acid:cation symporter [Synechococcales bacterium]
MSLSTLILLALALGSACGAIIHSLFPAWIEPAHQLVLQPLGQIFLRLIQFVVVPIVFSSLILGLTRIQSADRMGRYTLKLLLSYLGTGVVAIGLGLLTAQILHPGVGLVGFSHTIVESTAQAPSLIDWLVSLIPTNPIAALGSTNLLQVILSGALVGIGIQQAGEQGKPFVAIVESVYAISEKILFLILNLAPIGVFALIASVIAVEGLELLVTLSAYMMGVVLAIVLMMALYALLLTVLGADPVRYFKSFFPALSLAFGTASSNAALPIALQNAQNSYGLSQPIASFAIPLGTALKRDGMAVGQAFNALFIAQLYDVPLTPNLWLAIALSTLLVSFSTAGVPGAGIVMMTTIFSAAGLPLEGVAILAGVDRLMDSFHTLLNVMGNTVNAIILARWEGEAIAPTTEMPAVCQEGLQERQAESFDTSSSESPLV